MGMEISKTSTRLAVSLSRGGCDVGLEAGYTSFRRRVETRAKWLSVVCSRIGQRSRRIPNLDLHRAVGHRINRPGCKLDLDIARPRAGVIIVSLAQSR